MDIALYVAALLILAVSFAHSYLGERYIIKRLFRLENLPKLSGSDEITKRTLRFAWHVTTVAWLGFAALLISLTQSPIKSSTLGTVIGLTFLAHFAIAFGGSRGRHLSWPLFLAIGVMVIAATRT